MKIKIIKRITVDIVEFECMAGIGLGTITSDYLRNNETGSAEVDIPEDLEFEKNVLIYAEEKYSINHIGETNTIYAVIEAIDDDGLIWLRLSNDCLIPIMVQNGRFNEDDCLKIQVHASELQIY